MYTIFKSLFIKVREVEICEYLWDIMQLENSNIRQLYEKTGISKIKLIHFFKSDYKKGKSVPSIDTLYLICKFLDVSSDYLLGLEDQ